MSLSKPKKGNLYLRDKRPELRAQFVKALDARQSTFDELSSGSGIRCVWQCPKTNCAAQCPHTWETSVCNRANKSSGCPICLGRVVCRCNSLDGLRADLLKEYSPENTRSPFTLAIASNCKVKWVCSQATCNHHVWEDTVADRTGPKSVGCPFCSSHRCCPCYNLLTEFPDIAAEFDYEKNSPLTPEQIAPHSGKRIWWFCKVHSYHWEVTLRERTKSNSPGCRFCRMSGLEFHAQKALQNLLEARIIVGFTYDKRLPSTRMRADFWVTLPNGRSAIIELDGEQHYRAVHFGSSSRSAEKQFEAVQRRDLEKRKWCEKNHVHLLRISFRVPKEDYQQDLMDYFEWCKTAPGNLSAISSIHVNIHLNL